MAAGSPYTPMCDRTIVAEWWEIHDDAGQLGSRLRERSVALDELEAWGPTARSSTSAATG